MSRFVPLFARNEEINKWLSDNPLVMAAIFGAIGAILLFTGVRSLMTGQATGKWGTQHEGGMAMVIGGVRVAGGVVCLGVTLYSLAKAIL